MANSVPSPFHILDEPTLDLKDIAIPTDSSVEKPGGDQTRKVLDSNHVAFTVPNLLSRAECQGLINYAEAKTFEPVARDSCAHVMLSGSASEPVTRQYMQHRRDGSRRLIRAPRIADALFQRLLPLLRREDFSAHIPLCFTPRSGVWTPLKCNDVIKIVKYTPHGERHDPFAPHRDGPWMQSENQVSTFSVIVYLNDEYDGGHTKLLGDSLAAERPTAAAPFVAPTTGKGLVFNHDCLHAAAPIHSGVKYVLRTEIIFQRSGVYSGVVRFANLNEALYITSKQLYDASQAASDEETKHQLFDQYQRLFAVQQQGSADIEASLVGAESNYVRSSLICSNPRATATMDAQAVALAAQRPRLSEGPLSIALEFVPDADLATLLRTCKAMHHLVSISSMWRSRCLTRFGELFARQMRVAAPGELEQHLPWLAMYRREKLWQQRLTSFAVWPSTLGGIVNWTEHSTPFQGRATSHVAQRLNELSPLVAEPTPSPWLPIKTFAGLLPAYYNGEVPSEPGLPAGLCYTTEIRYQFDPRWYGWQASIVRANGSVLWEMLPMSLASACDTQSNVMLLVDAPQWLWLENDEERQSLRMNAMRECFDVFACPGVSCLSVEECFRARWAYQHGCRIDQIPTVRVVLVYPSGMGNTHVMSSVVHTLLSADMSQRQAVWDCVWDEEEAETWSAENIVVVDAFLAVSSQSTTGGALDDRFRLCQSWPTVAPTYVTEGALIISMAPDFRYTRVCFRPAA